MTKDKKNIVFTVLTLFFSILSIIPLMRAEVNSPDLFGLEIYKMILPPFWLLYFICTIFIKPFIIPLNIEYSVFSIIGTSFIIFYGIINFNSDIRRFNYLNDKKKELEALIVSNRIDSLETICRFQKENSEVCFEVGLAYRKKGNPQKSISYLNIAISRDSSVSKYYQELAYSSLMMSGNKKEDLKKALDSYEKAYYLDTSEKWLLQSIEDTKGLLKRENIKLD